MARERGAVRLGIREHRVALGDTGPAGTEYLAWAVMLVFDHGRNRNLNTELGEHALGCPLLRSTSVFDYRHHSDRVCPRQMRGVVRFNSSTMYPDRVL